MRLHLWGGLVMGPLILALGVSGMALVFRTELEQIIDGTPAVVSAGNAAPSFDGVVRAAHVRYPAATWGCRPIGAALGAAIGTAFGAEACIVVAAAGFLAQAAIILASPVPRLARQPMMMAG